MIKEATLEACIQEALGCGQVVFLKVTSPSGYAFLCWVYSDPSPYSKRIHALYTEHGSGFSLTNTHCWATYAEFSQWLSQREVMWLEPEQLTALLTPSF